MGRKITVKLDCGLEATYEQWGKGKDKTDWLEIELTDFVTDKPIPFSELILLITELKQKVYENYNFGARSDPYGSIDGYYISTSKLATS
jgi:hypothetical protein